jgi:hypothetical protein
MLAVLPYARGRGFDSRSRLLLVKEHSTFCFLFSDPLSDSEPDPTVPDLATGNIWGLSQERRSSSTVLHQEKLGAAIIGNTGGTMETAHHRSSVSDQYNGDYKHLQDGKVLWHQDGRFVRQ